MRKSSDSVFAVSVSKIFRTNYDCQADAMKRFNHENISVDREMAILKPYVDANTSKAHPEFPGTLGAFDRLTESQLDALADHFHQSSPSEFTNSYPIPITWSPSLPESEKRRKFGKFIGLQGCESPPPYSRYPHSGEGVWELPYSLKSDHRYSQEGNTRAPRFIEKSGRSKLCLFTEWLNQLLKMLRRMRKKA